MLKRLAAHFTEPSTNGSIFIPLLMSILFGVAGAALNVFAIPYLPHVNIIFGNAAYVIIAMRLRPAFALLTAIIAVTPLMFIWGHPFGYITFGLEAFFIAKLREKGWYVFFADVIYWLVIGIPLTAGIIWHFLPNTDEYMIFTSIKQGINALLYTSIGCLIVFFLNDKLRFRQYQQPPVIRGLRSQLMYSILLVTCCAVVVITQIESRNIIDNEQKLVSKTLTDSANSVADISNVYLAQHRRVIALAAVLLSDTQPALRQKKLEQIHQHFSDFKTMLVANSTGQIQQASPHSLLPILEQMPHVNDRQYFQQAINHQQVYVSPAFQGRGFGDDRLVAISAPIYDDVEHKIPSGIIEGSLQTNIAAQLALANFGKRQISIVIVDQEQKVIYASPALNLTPLTPFHTQDIMENLPTKEITLTNSSKQYLYAKKTLTEHWQVYALMDNSQILSNVERQFIYNFIILTATLCVSALVAFSFSQRLTQPLNFILKQISAYDQKDSEQLAPLYMNTTREISQIYEELKADKLKVHDYQTQLEQKVTLRTKKLNLANEKLQQLALRDGLTGAFNRYYLDENFSIIQKTTHRHNSTLALAMLDIDHFKRLNDNYGHLTGDQCLIKLAKVIQQHFGRETDTLIRFGGEEFLLLLPDISESKLIEMLETLRIKIAELLFYSTEQETLSFTVSIGAIIAEASYHTELREWVKVADDALYAAKKGGRNKVIIDSRLATLSKPT